MKVYGITGWKNAGKTTLVERVVTELTGRGYRVSTVKHAHHAVEIDKPGKDSHRHRTAGAGQVMLATDSGWALMTQAHDVPLKTLLSKLDQVDLVLVEGYKRDRHAKIEAHRVGAKQPLISQSDPTIRAVATDDPYLQTDRDLLDLNNPVQIADYILKKVGLNDRSIVRLADTA